MSTAVKTAEHDLLAAGPDALLEAHDQAPEHHREDGEAREAEEDRLEANLH